MRGSRSSSTSCAAPARFRLANTSGSSRSARPARPVSLRVAPMPCAGRYTARRCSPAGSSRCRAPARTTACTAASVGRTPRRAAIAFPPTRSSNVRTLATIWDFARSFCRVGKTPSSQTTCCAASSRASMRRIPTVQSRCRSASEAARATSVCMRRAPNVTCCVTRRQAPRSTGVGIPPRCRLRTACAVCPICARSGMRWVPASWWARRFKPRPTLRVTCASSSGFSPRCAASARSCRTMRRRFPPLRQARRNSRAICCRSSGSSSRMCCFPQPRRSARSFPMGASGGFSQARTW